MKCLFPQHKLDQRQPKFQLPNPKHSFPLNSTITFTKVKFIHPPLKVMLSSDCTVPQLPDVCVALGLTAMYFIRFCGENTHCRAADEEEGGNLIRNTQRLTAAFPTPPPPQTGSVWLNEQASGGGSLIAICQSHSPLRNQP